VTASLSYLSPPFLTAIAFVYLFSPNAGLINVLVRDVLGLPFLTFNIFSMTGLVLVTVLHTFPFVYLLAVQRAAVGRRIYEEAAQILGASKLRTALTMTRRWWRRPFCRERCSPSSTPSRCSARRPSSACPDAS
jgi:iron(III) transport system permease protein